MSLNNQEFLNCVEKIEKLFWYDTITFLDCVLTDDEKAPEYSANTCYDRLEMVATFETLYLGKEDHNVISLLLENGYTVSDIETLNRKRAQETQGTQSD